MAVETLAARVNVLGVGISPINIPIALQRLDEWFAKGAREYVCVCPVHTVMLCRRSQALRRIVNASGMTTPDGMPMVWLARWAGHQQVARVYGPDLMLAALEHSVGTGHRHYFYGGQPGIAQRLQQVMEQRFPGVQVVGTLTPPMGSAEQLSTPEVAAEINATRPDIVWVGVSSPKQDLLMAGMRPRLNAAVLIGVGAAFDFHTGRVAQAPAWVQQSGFEWLFRLVHEPRRLWRRYLVDNPWFLFELFRQKTRLKQYPLA